MKILFVTSSLFPYRVNWLDELGKYAQVKVLYLMDSDKTRNKEWCAERPKTCHYTLMKSIYVPKLGLISFDFIKLLKKSKEEYDIIILDGYGFSSQLLNLLYLNFQRIVYYVNIDGMIPNEHQKIAVSWIKKHIISRIPYCLCGSKAVNELLIKYGTQRDRIINHPFTSLYKKEIFSTVTEKKAKKAIREKLKINEKNVVISVGRFSYKNGYGKGYDVLLRVARKMSDKIGWYIIGGQPTEEFSEMINLFGLKNVHFIDFKKKEDLLEYYRASDVFVLMTVGDVWGLVINESMACGLPVITTKKCVAGLDLVKNGENGFLIDVGDDEALIDRLEYIFADDRRIHTMGEDSLKKIKNYSIEQMAQIHMETFIQHLQQKKLLSSR